MLTSGAFGYLADYLLWWLVYLSLLVHAWCFFRFFPRERLKRSGVVLGNALVFLCLLGFVALGGESYFRFVCVETDAFGLSLPARRWFALHTRLNSVGCRDKEWTAAKPPGVRRIAFVGDSFTYGWGIERAEDRFPDRIQTMFAAQSGATALGGSGSSPGATTSSGPDRDRRPVDTFPGVEIMNVAKPGWDTGTQLQPIKDMIGVYGADEIVLCYLPNDIEKLLPRSDDFDPIRPPEMKFLNPTTSCLVDYIFYRVCVPRAPTVAGYHEWLAGGFADPDIWRRHQQQLYDVIHHCRQAGVTLRVVLLPYIRLGGDESRFQRVYATLGEFFEANDVEVLDLRPAITGYDASELVVNSHDPHPNEQANELFAGAIWEAFYNAPKP